MLREEFDKIKKELKKDLNIKNDLRIPMPKFAVISIGIGKLVTSNPDNKDKIIEEASYVLSMITGQKPKIVKAKKSIAGFKLRKNMPIALLVTLRGKRLLDFIERLVTYILPRVRDFKGIKGNNLDAKGNLNLGIKEYNVFPEAISDKIKEKFGIGITITATGRNREENIKLWEKLGFPIKI